jgi:hypothetical protein
MDIYILSDPGLSADTATVEVTTMAAKPTNWQICQN